MLEAAVLRPCGDAYYLIDFAWVPGFMTQEDTTSGMKRESFCAEVSHVNFSRLEASLCWRSIAYDTEPQGGRMIQAAGMTVKDYEDSDPYQNCGVLESDTDDESTLSSVSPFQSSQSASCCSSRAI